MDSMRAPVMSLCVSVYRRAAKWLSVPPGRYSTLSFWGLKGGGSNSAAHTCSRQHREVCGWEAGTYCMLRTQCYTA
jgi:hypothetical protein